jgi:hypothetical protein
MSYINKNRTALVRTKLTDIGRELLAKGQLTFNSWIAGDSEVDYGYVKGWKDFVPSSTAATGQFFFHVNTGGTEINYSAVLRPKDKQYFPKSFLIDGNANFIQPFGGESSVKLIKGVISNQADDRGFFSGSTVDDGLTAVTSTKFFKEVGTIDLGKFSGETDTTTFTKGVLRLDTPLTASSVNDILVFNLSNSTLGSLTGTSTETTPSITQFYMITDLLDSGSTVNVDRALPIFTADSGTISSFYVIPGGNNPADDYYGENSLTAYWHTGTLSFDSSCDICVENIPVWNMNNPWVENMAGQFKDTTDFYHNHELFGSEEYVGTHLLMNYKDTPEITQALKESASSYIDTFQKGISIIHYTNSCISNFYGEFFHIDGESGKLLNLDLPIMWHRKDDIGTASGETMGMRFVSDTVEKTLDNTNIIYYDLIEFSGMSTTPDSPLAVGKVFPNEKIVVIDNEEILAAMSYKSNRNWTLPDLAAHLSAPVNGDCTGILKAGERLYLTYYMTANSGVTTTLPCQRYTAIDNHTTSDKDIHFRLDNVDQLPYMRKVENGGYDGKGFYANEFKILAQVVDPTVTDRPDPKLWREIDFTSTNITTNSGETIDPILLEDQNPTQTGFILEGPNYTGATIFNLGNLMDLPQGTFYNKMNFGDERLFYGNLRTYIGATVYKSLFSVNIDGAEFGSSTNPTYETGGDRFVTEIAILDNNQNVVMIGKLSRPIKIANSSTATIEITMDF